MNTKKKIKKVCKASQDADFEGFSIIELSPYLHKVEKAYTSKTKQPVPVRFLQQVDLEIYTDVTHLPIYNLLKK